ncbi:DEAD-box ATP-dependent RNA helicase 16 [Morella rubra]|uniref:RNA helicase n=1 Tax=Morella rubra TaxID=262757 RepID=A0A6A1UNS0_9ROSI|nr:DEAD-box ATP-dependent RNA helicase 16 [Morella rubra]
MGYRFGIKSAVLNSELPQNSRLHILEEFNAGLFDYLIATDDSHTKEKEEANGERNAEPRKSRKHAKPKADSEFGVVRGIDFKNVHTAPKRARNGGGIKREDKGGDDRHKHKKKKSF